MTLRNPATLVTFRRKTLGMPIYRQLNKSRARPPIPSSSQSCAAKDAHPGLPDDLYLSILGKVEYAQARRFACVNKASKEHTLEKGNQLRAALQEVRQNHEFDIPEPIWDELCTALFGPWTARAGKIERRRSDVALLTALTLKMPKAILEEVIFALVLRGATIKPKNPRIKIKFEYSHSFSLRDKSNPFLGHPIMMAIHQNYPDALDCLLDHYPGGPKQAFQEMPVVETCLKYDVGVKLWRHLLDKKMPIPKKIAREYVGTNTQKVMLLEAGYIFPKNIDLSHLFHDAVEHGFNHAVDRLAPP